MTAYQQSFKSWVPRWLMVVSILMVLVPVGSALGIYLGGINSAMSYYGAAPRDIQFSVVVYYLAVAGGFALEKKFFNRFASKPYITGAIIIYIILNVILYFNKSLALLFVFRFLGGLLSLVFIGSLFTLIFQQFHSQRMRVLGYAVLYGALLGSAPLSYILDAFVFTNYNFNVLFLLKIYICLPGFILLFVSLRNDVELRREKLPLKNVDWPSFVLYTSALILIAYILLYGQYYNWFYSQHIVIATVTFVVVLMLYFFRQLKLKEPYIDLSIYKYRNYRIGMLLLVAFYLAKGDTSVANGFLANSVNLDVYHKGYVMIINGLGLLVGICITARFVLSKRSMRLIWLTGFGTLLAYHIMMISLIGSQASTYTLLLPLFLQGFGNGTLMLSIIIFYATGVPQEVGFSASVTGVSYRFFGFTLSMALISFMGLRQNSIHYNDLAGQVVSSNEYQQARAVGYKQALLNHGASELQAMAGVKKLESTAVKKQTDLLYARDYYFYVSCFIGLVMLAIALIPHLHYYMRKIGDKLIPV